MKTQKSWLPEELEALKGPDSITAKATRLGRTVWSVQNKLRELRRKGQSLTRHEGKPPVRSSAVALPTPEFGRISLKCVDLGAWHRYGLIGDTHLCCKEERLAELHAQYDLFKREGIRTVFHAGNIVDGYVQRINGASVFDTTIDGQVQYVVDNYPCRRGVTTYFITGDDHESWFAPGFNFGAYLQHIARDQNRKDLIYIGHIESDVEIKFRSGASTIIKIQHPGGGSAYARSYTGQKQVESWEGGEKPNILVQGHYHVSNYMQDRNVHVISLPGFQDQTVFARKKRLRMEVGAAILEFKVNPDDGTVTRCRVEFNRYFTRGYYKPYLKSDVKVLKGHLILKG
jgi:predicted phosphodiesterase